MATHGASARSGIARSDLVATHAYRVDWSLSLVLTRSDLR